MFGLRAAVVAASIACALVGCVTVETTAPGSETSISTSTRSGSVPQPTITERVRSAGAEAFGIGTGEVDVSDPQQLAPSDCTLYATLDPSLVDGGTTRFVHLPDDSLIRVGTDEALGLVSRRCFLDAGLLPNQEGAELLVLQIGAKQADRVLQELEGTRVLGELGEEWAPTTVAATEDGFVITVFVARMLPPAMYELTATVAGETATTEYRPID